MFRVEATAAKAALGLTLLASYPVETARNSSPFAARHASLEPGDKFCRLAAIPPADGFFR
jgi:hypothetical protein